MQFESLPSSTQVFLYQTVGQLSIFLPRILAAFLVFVIGIVVAKAIGRFVNKILEAIKFSRLIEKTPVEMFLKNADMSQKVEVFIGKIVYWLVMLIVLHSTLSILGLTPVTQILERFMAYIPHVFTAIIVLFFGVLLAGLVEGVVKGAIKSIDGHASRILGKISSYLVITIAILAAISELGIASEFILIFFIGFVAMLALGFGLAIGLGAKGLIERILTDWYEKNRKEIEE